MVRKEIAGGYLIAGFLTVLVPVSVWHSVFATGHGFWTSLQNVIVGPFIAMISFVCSVGNVPLAAVLWSGGISFGGVLAFLFADLIVIPILLIYRKYYGTAFAVRITALMFVTIVIAALAVDGVFNVLGLIPTGPRPTRGDIFTSIHVDYKLALNVLGLVIFTAMFWLTARRGATDPVCGMSVDRSKAVSKEFGGETYYFCSSHCLHAFEAEPHEHRPARAVSGRPRWHGSGPPASGTELR
jgi:YHS domain-containing protein